MEAGIEGRTERVIDDSLLTRHVGGKGVFATPAMILLMENTAHGSVAPLIGDDKTTVGYEVCVKHLGMSEPGATVVVTSLLKEVSGNKLLFDVHCHDGDRGAGAGLAPLRVPPPLACLLGALQRGLLEADVVDHHLGSPDLAIARLDARPLGRRQSFDVLAHQYDWNTVERG